MSTEPRSGESSRSASQIYFIIAFVLLMIMGLTWSLDSSIVYLILGSSVFFFFLAYWNRPKSQTQTNYQEFKAGRTKPPQQDPWRAVRDVFRQAKQQAPTGQEISSKGIRVIVTAGIFITVIFFIIIISVIVSDPEMSWIEYYQRAENARYAQSYDSAMIFYRKVLADEPDHLDSWNGMGIVKLDLREYDSAVYFFDGAIDLDEDYDFARYNKALAFYYKKDYARSLSETRSLMNHSPQYYDAMELAGNNYYSQQRYDSARYWYQEGYDNGVRNAWICHVLGYLYDQQKQEDKAIALFRESLSYDSTNVEVYERLSEHFPGSEGNFYRRKIAELNGN